MRARHRVIAAVVCAIVLAPLAFVSSAAQEGGEAGRPDSVVREMVVSIIRPDGAVRSTRVAQLIRLNGGEVSVTDDESVDRLRSLSGFGTPARDGEELVWRNDGRSDDVVLTEVSKDLPVEIEISYQLDGRTIEADELKGKEGRVRIEIAVENVSGATKSLSYEPVTGTLTQSPVRMYVPLEYSILTTFPGDRWSDLVAEDAYIQTNEHGDEDVIRPGLLSPPLTPARNEVVFEATTEDAALPDFRIVAWPRVSPEAAGVLDQQIEAIGELYGGLGEISKNLDLLYDGSVDLVDGVQKLVESVGARDENTKQPVINLDAKGEPTTLIGALGFIRNAIRDQLLPGIGARNRQTGEPIVTLDAKGEPTTLIGALGFMEGAISDQVLPGLTNPAFTTPQTALGGAVPKDYFQDCPACWDPDADLYDPRTANPALQPALRDAFVLFSEGLGEGLEGLQTLDADNPGLVEGLEQIGDGLGAVIGQLRTFDPVQPGLVDGLEQVRDGLGALNAKLDTLGTGQGFRETLLQVKGLAATGQAQTSDPLAANLFQFIGLATDGLLAGLGNRNPDGTPNIVLDSNGQPTTIIGGIGYMQGAVGQQLLPALGDVNPVTKKPIITLDANGEPTTLIGALGFMQSALVGQILPQIGERDPETGRAVETYFDDKHAQSTLLWGLQSSKDNYDQKLIPGVDELIAGMRDLQSGLGTVTGQLQTFDPASPGLVDGMQQVQGGVDSLISKLHTFDAKDPGLVDGMELLRGGAQQLSQGVFAINELGVRTAHGQIGDTADGLAKDKATVDEQVSGLKNHTFLTENADAAFTTYVFELPAQATTSRDNAVRGGLIGMSLLGLALAGGRRPFGIG